jgi:hypothetical protein
MAYRRLLAVYGLLLLCAMACSSNPLAPFQPEITNAPDNFQFQATAVQHVTTTVNYTWQNTGATANVNQACSITGGTATLTILDADSVQVYTRNLADNGTYATVTGTTGS